MLSSHAILSTAPNEKLMTLRYSGYLNAGKIARYIAINVSIPAKKPKETDVHSILRAVRVTWRAEVRLILK